MTTTGSTFLAACRGEPVEHTPVWFMRQAGRSLPEYRRLREGVPMLAACLDPDTVVEVTLQPIRRFAPDAAVLFSDIVVPLVAAGVDLDIVPGTGPVIAEPIRTQQQVRALPGLHPDQLGFLTKACQQLVAALGDTPLLGFAGAPFTLASYLIEGGPSKDHSRTKALMHTEPGLFADLLARLAEVSTVFLDTQLRAGARAFQLFDSWAGTLDETDYRRHVLPHSKTVFSALAATHPEVPRVHFGVGTGELLGAMAEAGATVVGVDWRVPLDRAAQRIPAEVGVQGNLDPAVLLGPWEAIEPRVTDVLRRGRAARSHVFNLGHGVLPGTDPGVLAAVVAAVHAWRPGQE